MIFEHTKVKLPNSAKFGISPSSISKFFDSPVIWYKENILKEEIFKGSTATVRGTCAHYMAECAATGKSVDHELLQQELMEISNPDIDISEVIDTYNTLGELLVDYVTENPPNEVETQLYAEVKQGIYVKGTCDARQGSTVVDFKTASKKPSDTIPFGYFIQLMAYAYMYRQQGQFVDKIRLVYAVSPTKTLPARRFVVSKTITNEDWEMIENTLELIADTLIVREEQPELDYLLFKSMQFKQKPKPILFNKG